LPNPKLHSYRQNAFVISRLYSCNNQASIIEHSAQRLAAMHFSGPVSLTPWQESQHLAKGRTPTGLPVILWPEWVLECQSHGRDSRLYLGSCCKLGLVQRVSKMQSRERIHVLRGYLHTETSLIHWISARQDNGHQYSIE
jgi:hypothetical protein